MTNETTASQPKAASIDAVTLADAINTVFWLERRLPKGYDEVPHVQRTKARLRAALESSIAPSPDRTALTDAQITAGSNILCDCPEPKRIGRNAAIDVFQAMGGVAQGPVAQSLAVSATPKGWQLVPIYPTDLMLQNASANPIWPGVHITAEKAWRNMLAVAPKHPGAPQPVAAAQAVSEDDQRDAAAYRALNTPEIADFMKGVEREALHQRGRWSAEHDAGKAPEDWFWLLGYLGGKALHAAKTGNKEKALHHTISSAAALLNWHAAILGTHTDMRPGIAQPTDTTREA